MPLVDLYFAYGADMDLPTIRARAGGAEFVSAARLRGYRLAFFGHNPVWDSGVETIVADDEAELWGVLYRLRPAEWDRLDTFHGAMLEGTGAYFHYPIEVTTPAKEQYQVRTYRKSSHGQPRLPSSEYLAHLAASATSQGVPATYQSALQALPSIPATYPVPKKDPTERRRLHLI
jgi:gamma-glutamylcyclotransferase (GGCT)/AIG2-like uncharacterized protein YtfP